MYSSKNLPNSVPLEMGRLVTAFLEAESDTKDLSHIEKCRATQLVVALAEKCAGFTNLDKGLSEAPGVLK